MKKVRKLLKRYWKRILFTLIALIIIPTVLLFKLSALAPSLSPTEKATLAASHSLHTIINNPLHLPLKILLWTTRFAPTHHILLFSRLPSVLLAAASLAIFIYILKRWYGPRTAAFGFIIFALSAWFLHVGRFIGTDIEYLTGVLALLAIHVGLYDHDDRPSMAYLWLITNLALLFIPGFVWFILLSLVWQRAELVAAWQKLRLWHRIPLILIALAGLAGIVYSIGRTTHLIKVWLGAPETLGNWHTMLNQLTSTLEAFVYQGPHNPELWLARLPILDVFLSLMLIAGVAFYIRHWRASRTRLLLSYTMLGIILTSLGGAVRLSVVVPIIYLITIAGLAYVLHFWLSVFPRNPFARTAGITVVVAIIALSTLYSLEQYFVAWPHNEEVAKVYHQSSP